MVSLALHSTRMVQPKDRLRRVVMTLLAAYWVLYLLLTGLNAWVLSPNLSALSQQTLVIFWALTALNLATFATLAFVTVRAINRPVRWEWQILCAALVYFALTKAPVPIASMLSASDGNGWGSIAFAMLTPVIVLTQILFLRWSRA